MNALAMMSSMAAPPGLSPLTKHRMSGRFDSISEELAAINSGVIDGPSTVDQTDTREPCPRCGRKFRPDRLGKHIGVCKALQEGKEARGVFNASSPMLATPAGGGGGTKGPVAGRRRPVGCCVCFGFARTGPVHSQFSSGPTRAHDITHLARRSVHAPLRSDPSGPCKTALPRRAPQVARAHVAGPSAAMRCFAALHSTPGKHGQIGPAP